MIKRTEIGHVGGGGDDGCGKSCQKLRKVGKEDEFQIDGESRKYEAKGKHGIEKIIFGFCSEYRRSGHICE
jgi:hypothetical protein